MALLLDWMMRACRVVQSESSTRNEYARDSTGQLGLPATTWLSVRPCEACKGRCVLETAAKSGRAAVVVDCSLFWTRKKKVHSGATTPEVTLRHCGTHKHRHMLTDCAPWRSIRRRTSLNHLLANCIDDSAINAACVDTVFLQTLAEKKRFSDRLRLLLLLLFLFLASLFAHCCTTVLASYFQCLILWLRALPNCSPTNQAAPNSTRVSHLLVISCSPNPGGSCLQELPYVTATPLLTNRRELKVQSNEPAVGTQQPTSCQQCVSCF